MQPVSGFYFRSQRLLRRARDRLEAAGLRPLEADLNPVERYLMERFVRGSIEYQESKGEARVRASSYQPTLRMVSVDIETAIDSLELYSIGVYAMRGEDIHRRVFMRGRSTELDWVVMVEDEAALLEAFCRWLEEFV